MTRVWIRYAAIMALLVSAYFALPQSRPVVEAGVGLAAVGAVEFSVRRLRPQRAGAWRGLEVALALLAIGDVIFAIMDVGSPVPVPYPALPDAFYLAAYLPLTIALLWLGRPHTRRSGHIEYATPSAQTLFGRDVLGERVDDIVGHNRPVDLGPAQADAATDGPLWSDTADDTEATIHRPDGERTVLVHRRDLTDEPTVRGIVTTMSDVTAERALQRDLAYRASHDELTGLANVRAWEDILMADGERGRGPGRGIAVIAIDLDNFKGINDRHGHPVGDQVLAEVAPPYPGLSATG